MYNSWFDLREQLPQVPREAQLLAQGRIGATGEQLADREREREQAGQVRGCAMNPVEHPHGGGNHQHARGALHRVRSVMGFVLGGMLVACALFELDSACSPGRPCGLWFDSSNTGAPLRLATPPLCPGSPARVRRSAKALVRRLLHAHVPVRGSRTDGTSHEMLAESL